MTKASSFDQVQFVRQAFICLTVIIVLAFASVTKASTIVVQPSVYGTYQVQYFAPIGQTFTAVDSELEAAGLYINPINGWSFTSSMTMSIYEGAGAGGTLLGSQVFNPAAGYSGFYELNWVGLLGPLVIGNTYSMALSAPHYYWGVSASNSDVYAGGQFFTNQGFDAGKDAGFTLTFASSNSVPDAGSTLFLMLLSVSGLFAYAARKARGERTS